VSFGSAEDFESHWVTYIARGALPVRPERALQPLELLDVYVLAPGLTTVFALKVEVVQLTAERALLRLVEPAPAKPTLPAAANPPPVPPAAGLVDVAGASPAAPARPTPPDVALPALAPVMAAPVVAPPVVAPPVAPEIVAAPAVLVPCAVGPVVPSAPVVAPAVALPVVAIAAEGPTLEDSVTAASPTVAAAPAVLDEAPGVAPAAVTPTGTPPAVLSNALISTADVAPPLLAPAGNDAPADLPAIVLPVADASSVEGTAQVAPAASAPSIATPAVAAPVVGSAPAAPAGAAPSAAGMPAWFTGDALRFQSHEDFKAARGPLLGAGAVLTIVDGKVPLALVEVKLAVGAKETRAKTKVTLSAAAAGTAVVQANEKNGFRPLVDELDLLMAPPAPVAVPEPASTAPRAFALPRQGALANPTTPAGILALPLVRPPNDAELSPPSVPVLLRWLRTQRGLLRLEVTAEDRPVFTAVFVDGREVRTPASLQTLGKALALQKMTYTIVELGRPPQMTTTARTQHLIGEVVRALCLQCSVEDLAKGFPVKAGMCPRAVQDVVTSLGLPPQHARFVKSDVDGSQFIEQIARAAAGGRTVWETLYLLEVCHGIVWDEPPANKKERSTGAADHQQSAKVPEDAWTPFEGRDHFHVLGLHWSSSPTEVAPAYQSLRHEFGPGGVKRPANAQMADKILKRLEEAYRALNDPDTRRAYRREKYNLVWTHQAQLLVQKAKLALYRKDWVETESILLAAEDLAPSPEAKQLLAALKQKTKGP
jgi:hypothetical protein